MDEDGHGWTWMRMGHVAWATLPAATASVPSISPGECPNSAGPADVLTTACSTRVARKDSAHRTSCTPPRVRPPEGAGAEAGSLRRRKVTTAASFADTRRLALTTPLPGAWANDPTSWPVFECGPLGRRRVGTTGRAMRLSRPTLLAHPDLPPWIGPAALLTIRHRSSPLTRTCARPPLPPSHRSVS